MVVTSQAHLSTALCSDVSFSIIHGNNSRNWDSPVSFTMAPRALAAMARTSGTGSRRVFLRPGMTAGR